MLTYSTRLVFQDKEDEQKIFKMLESQRFTFNECSKIKFNSITKNSIVELHAKFYRDFRDNYPNIPSNFVICTEQECLSKYRSVKTSKHKIHKPIEKKKLSVRLNRNVYSYKNKIFRISSLEKRVKCYPHIYSRLQELLNKYSFGDPELFVKNNEIWIALTFDIPEILPTNKLALGIDLGCRVNAATSEGKLYIDKKFNGEKRKLRHLKDCLKSKSTKNSKSACRHLKKLRRKEANKNRNFCHELSKKLILDTKADTLVLENLKSIKVKKHKYENKNRISQVPLYQLKQFLTYKAPLYGKTVIEVCPSYTSQIDSTSGKRDGVRKGRRYYSKNGKVLDADVNAAVNIGRRSKLPVSYGNILDGQAIVNSPIVGVGRSQTTIL